MIDALKKKIESREARIGVIGLGYVGLPLALVFAEKGFSVLGLDVDQVKVDKVNRGEGYIQHLQPARLASAVAEGRLSATVDFGRLAEMDAIIIAVPTPLTRQREPELKYVMSTVTAIAKTLRAGQLIILESTTYPGTTDGPVLTGLEASGKRLGQDFYLAFSPEREDPGNKHFNTKTIPKVVGGVDDASGDLAEALYAAALDKTVRVQSARAAEATKLTENIYRAVNIALVNELKVVYDAMNIDVWDVLDAAETKPFGFTRFNPGPGWGGHCIPLDPFYLAWKAREYGKTTRFIELAGEINVQMTEYVVGKTQLALNDQGKAVRGSKVLILGIAYKKDIDDPRESPAFDIVDKLLQLGAEVSYHDPHIPEAPRMRSWPDLPAMSSVGLDVSTLSNFDAAILVTDHTGVDYQAVAESVPVFVDTRGVLRSGANVVKA